MTSAILRILSGAHQGAEIPLTPGTWVIGSDDSCDIILSDASIEPRHAALTVADDACTQAPLDGKVLEWRSGKPASEVLLPRTPYRLGAITLAWAPEPATPQDWQAVAAAMAAAAEPAAPKAPDKPQEAAGSGADGSGDGKIEPTLKGGLPQAESGAEETAQTEPEARRPGGSLWLMLLVPLLLAGGALYAWRTPRLFVPGPAAQAPLDPAAAAAKTLSEAGFARVRVSSSPDSARYFVTGAVANDAERGRLVALARHLNRPADIRVTVDSDLSNAIKSGFNARGIWPDVSFATKGRQRVLRVAGYMRDRVVEVSAFKEALSNVPPSRAKALPPIERDLRYRADIEPLVASALGARRLDGVRTEYADGKVTMVTLLTPERLKMLRDVALEVRRRAGVPVPIGFANATGGEAAKVAAAEPAPMAPAPAASGPRADSKPDFAVTSVSMGALPFVTLATGERVFKGGRLRGGYILEAISTKELKVSKDGKEISYPLKVK